MVEIEHHINLQPYNTFGLQVYCDYYTEIVSEKDFEELRKTKLFQEEKKLILGGGSNLLFVQDFNGLVIKNNMKGIVLTQETDSHVILTAGGGEIWHELVLYCIKNNFGGLENLSLIPGCVGAAPMQNIGAYGVEIKDVFHQLTALDMESGEQKIFNKNECQFGYRESVFKNKYKNRYLISSVSFRLSKQNHTLHTSYGAIHEQLKQMGVLTPGIKDISDAVIQIRQSKLPNPAETGNAGSFFKNPEVSEKKFQELKNQYPQLVAYPLENGNYKLAAGWLIEHAGLKGTEHEGAAVHAKQALVLINKNKASGKSVWELSEKILQTVNSLYGVLLEREVNIIS